MARALRCSRPAAFVRCWSFAATCGSPPTSSWPIPRAPLVLRHLRISIHERTDSDGNVPVPVPPEEIEAAVALMRAEGVGSVAIAFLHAYVNPENEREGAAPLHACHLAAKLRVGRVTAPLRAGVLSALDLLVAPSAYDIVRIHKVPLRELGAASIGALIDEMADSIASLLGRLDSRGELSFTRGVDVGYIGQSYQVTAPLDEAVDREAIWKRFATLYREKYGYFDDDVPAAIVNVQVLCELVGRELGLVPLPV